MIELLWINPSRYYCSNEPPPLQKPVLPLSLSLNPVTHFFSKALLEGFRVAMFWNSTASPASPSSP